MPEPVLPVLADARTPGSSLRRLIEASALAGARSVELVGQHPHSANLATLAKLDGVSVDYPDWHFNVRGSNTEPLLRLNLEAKTPELMERKRDEVLSVIRG